MGELLAERHKCDGEIRWLGELQRIRLEPGDVFVMLVERTLSNEQREWLFASWQKTALGAHQLIIMDGGMKLAVVGNGQPAASS